MNNLKLVINRTERKITHSRFPGGESLIRIECDSLFADQMQDEKIDGMITLNFRDNGDLIDLMMLVDACHRHFVQGINLSLNLDYLPYARQDRICNPGEALGVKVIADLINSLGFDHVYVKDIHSTVGAAVLNNLVEIKQEHCANRLASLFCPNETILVSPDAGAMKKVMAFAKEYKFPNVVCADKVRDTMTGEIKGIKLPAHQCKKEYLVLDDIVDGGRTFIELAKVIGDGNLNLYVTHGIFSNGVDELLKYYNTIYVSNMMNDNIIDPRVKVI